LHCNKIEEQVLFGNAGSISEKGAATIASTVLLFARSPIYCSAPLVSHRTLKSF